MASRGRGRGGGFGRGGRGAGQPGPVARDDDGNILPSQNSGPPPLFPGIKCHPPLPSLQPKDKLMLNRHRELLAFWKASPYYLGSHHQQAGAQSFTCDTHTERVKRKPTTTRASLLSVLTLESEYFPEELLSSSDKRHRADERGKLSAFKFGSTQGATGLGKLAQLAAMETMEKAAEEQGKSRKSDTEEAKDAQDEAELENLDEEDDEWAEDDDYLQGEHFDDDEGYDDDLDGGDEGAVY